MGYFREIFGPLLPVLPVENVDEAIKFVNERYDFSILFHPSLYIFVDHFGSATTPLFFMSSPRTSKSKAKVMLDSIVASSRSLWHFVIFQFSMKPKAVLS